MTFTELPQRWSVVVGGRHHDLTLAEIFKLRAACDQVLEHRSKSVEEIVKLVCVKFSLEQHELFSKDRRNCWCLARWCAWKILRDRGMSHSEIGRQFHKNHGTVISGLRRLQKKLSDNPAFKAELAWLSKQK